VCQSMDEVSRSGTFDLMCIARSADQLAGSSLFYFLCRLLLGWVFKVFLVWQREIALAMAILGNWDGRQLVGGKKN